MLLAWRPPLARRAPVLSLLVVELQDRFDARGVIETEGVDVVADRFARSRETKQRDRHETLRGWILPGGGVDEAILDRLGGLFRIAPAHDRDLAGRNAGAVE